MTDAERKLWSRLRNRQFLGRKFVRQQPVGHYIVDFACREADLVIELDGSQHSGAVLRDARRTDAIAEYGYRVRRFWNVDVLTNLDGVLSVIAADLEKAPTLALRHARMMDEG